MPKVSRAEQEEVMGEHEELSTDMHYLSWYGATDREEGKRREQEHMEDHTDTLYDEEELG